MYVKDLNTGKCYESIKVAPPDGDYVPLSNSRYEPIIDKTTGKIYETVGMASIGEGVGYEKMRRAIQFGKRINGKFFIRRGQRPFTSKEKLGKILDDEGNRYASIMELSDAKRITYTRAYQCVTNDPDRIFRNEWLTAAGATVTYRDGKYWINGKIPCVSWRSLVRDVKRIVPTVDPQELYEMAMEAKHEGS